MRAHASEDRLHLFAAMNQTLLLDESIDPIDVLFGDHYRIRAMLTLLQDCARATMSSRVRADLSRALATFLRIDLRRHLADEEECLFPMLQRRLNHSDLLDPSIRELLDDHAAMRTLAADLAEQATQLQYRSDLKPSATFRRVAAAFAAAKQQHIALENSVLLPLARERLGYADIRALARRLGQSRLRLAIDEKSAGALPPKTTGQC